MDKSNATIEIYILYCCDIWKTKPMRVKIATTRTQRLLEALCKCIIACLLYTSDAADDSLRVDLGGRRIIKKKIF